MGLFITLEGGEGSGKSTQGKLLASALEKAGIAFDLTREPGGTTGAESIRRLLVEGEPGQWDAMTETLLFIAARVDHVRKRIKPGLKAGKVVICDRFMDSTMAYQGAGKGISEEFLEFLHRFTLEDFKPDITFILDIEPEQGLLRASSRSGAETRFEKMEMEFHRRVRQAFLYIARQEPERCKIINAAEPPEKVQAEIQKTLHQWLQLS